MSADLTPPADAPLPWSIHIENDDTIDLDDGRSEYFGTLKCIEYTIARYLVAAANAAPGLVAERDAARSLATIEHGTAETLRRDVEAFKRDRDRAVMALDTDALHVYTARLARDVARQERDAALARAAAAEADLAAQCKVFAASIEESRRDHAVLLKYERSHAEADTVAGIADWLERLGYMSPEHVALVRAYAWRGKEGA